MNSVLNTPIKAEMTLNEQDMADPLRLYEELRGLMQETTQVLNKPQFELETIAEIKKIIRETEEERSKQQREVKRLIKEWQMKVKSVEQNESSVDAVEKLQQRQDDIDQKKYLTNRNINSLEQDCDSLEIQLAKLSDNFEQLKARRLEAENEALNELPAIKFAMGLYTNVSHLRWDYDSPFVKGYVAGNGNIYPFQLDPAKNSSYFITNYLWDLI